MDGKLCQCLVNGVDLQKVSSLEVAGSDTLYHGADMQRAPSSFPPADEDVSLEKYVL